MLHSSGGTDFWRVTEGITPRHDGHAVGFDVDGDFRFQLRAHGSPHSQFDQYGVIAIQGEERWLKAGLELDDDLWLSSVHTNGASDWCREPYGDPAVTVALARDEETLTVSVLLGGHWRALRILTLQGPLLVGGYACAPRGEGFSAEFYAASLSAAELRS